MVSRIDVIGQNGNTGEHYLEEQGVKHDAGKPDFSLLSPFAMTCLAQVLTFGAKKYEANNWRKGIPMSRLLAAAERHLTAIKAGLDTDEETQLPHAAHLMCEVMFICEQTFSPRGLKFDDRFSLDPQDRATLTGMLNGKT